MEALIAAAANNSVAKLKEMAVLLMDDFQDGADEVFQAVLAALNSKLPEAEFVAFCDTL